MNDITQLLKYAAVKELICISKSFNNLVVNILVFFFFFVIVKKSLFYLGKSSNKVFKFLPYFNQGYPAIGTYSLAIFSLKVLKYLTLYIQPITIRHWLSFYEDTNKGNENIEKANKDFILIKDNLGVLQNLREKVAEKQL